MTETSTLFGKITDAFIIFTSIVGLTTIIMHYTDNDFFISDKYMQSIYSLEYCISKLEHKINVLLKNQHHIVKELNKPLLEKRETLNGLVHELAHELVPELAPEVLAESKPNVVTSNAEKEDDVLMTECYTNIPFNNKKSSGLKGWFSS
jgi:hypothetical protein